VIRLAGPLVVLVSATAAAAPCAVDVVRAPEDVREVVEHWVSAEAQCAASLEVRIVATKDGLYVVARDRGGRVHDRVVPDAQTAGVLIASWAADTSVAGVTPVVPVPAAPAAVVPTAIIAMARPSSSDELNEEVQADERPAPHAMEANERRWIRLAMIDGVGSAMLSLDQDVGHTLASRGVRGSVGVWTRGPWTIDVSLDYVNSTPLMLGTWPGGWLSVRELDAFANLGYTQRHRWWSVTPSLGLGARYGLFDFTGAGPWIPDDRRRGLMPVAQASLLGALDLTQRVQLTLGMSAVFHPDPWDIYENLELQWIGGVGVAM
jgi:hypothetical protein